jgi:hypothetical protein
LALGAATLSACDDDVTVVTPAGVPGEGFFLTWQVTSFSLGAVSCEQVGASTVTLDMVNLDTGSRFLFTFACNQFQGTTSPVDIGNFDILIRLNDVGNLPLSEVSVAASNIGVAGIIDLGNIVFQVP